MEYYIAVFWSRTEAFSYSNNLKRMGIVSALIQTPKEAGRTCGLSVKFLKDYLNEAKELLKRGYFKSFGGWFLCTVQGNQNVVIKV